MSQFNSVLIANRGEIACRVIRTAKSLGYHTVAVYSDADFGAPHMKMADAAINIGAGPVNESYLVADKILAAAKQSGAQAIHPGYGFLSENADFSNACKNAGLVFIGPSALAIELMGNKAAAKRRMLEAGVPCVPGYEGEDQEDAVLIAEAEKVGFPIMVKAAAGGGGRGMRLVEEVSGLASAIKLARSEAKNAFGSGELILEKAIIEPRHVEVQVFADRSGNTVHLGERDCSVQRRHQKVVEEAPCPIMTEELRAQMGAAAVAAAQSINYEGAGTVEFLLDSADKFYFLEMNTRLQVEHPVTEFITGLDLVALQLQVAQGEELGLEQKDISLTGHAIEVRLYSEDPSEGFLPTSGMIDVWQPASGDGVRIDSGIVAGQEISPFYDPMVAKVIAYGENREIARKRLITALKQTALHGVKNNKTFLINCLEKQSFVDGAATTAFIGDEFDDSDLAEPKPTIAEASIAAVLEVELAYRSTVSVRAGVTENLKNWSSASPLVARRSYTFGDDGQDAEFDLSITSVVDGYGVSSAKGESLNLLIESIDKDSARVWVDGQRQDVRFFSPHNGSLIVQFGAYSHIFRDQISLAGAVNEEQGGGAITAPMHGRILEVKVSAGDQVSAGDSLLILEAMKMQHEIVAAANGTVAEIFAKAESQVSADDVLIEITVSD